ncbi:MAG: DUF2290 domain-containing protein [Candidatus Tenebribacter davisii]|nr:DUF2290 domain-containing protein [Candidatus Tenebribacter davisii]
MNFGTGKEYSQLNELSRLFKKFNILEEYNKYPDDIGIPLSEIRKLNYEDLWIQYFSTNSYHFHLNDDSLFFFNFGYNSFLYISNPMESMSISDFKLEHGSDNIASNHTLFPEYEQYLSECKPKEFPLLIRYDFDEHSYTKGSHPVSHIHFGFGNKTRIGVITKLDPESFVYLVIRQLYPLYWKEIIKDNDLKRRVTSNKNSLINIDNNYYNDLDKIEMYLKF